MSLMHAIGPRTSFSAIIPARDEQATIAGVAVARNDLIFFSDADVTGLTPEAITRILTPVLLRDYGMYVGVRSRKTYWMNRLLHFTPILGGERALSRSRSTSSPSRTATGWGSP